MARNLVSVRVEEEVQQILRDIDMYYLRLHWTVNTVPSFSFNIWQPYLKGYDGEGLIASSWRYWARYWIDQDLKKSMVH